MTSVLVLSWHLLQKATTELSKECCVESSSFLSWFSEIAENLSSDELEETVKMVE